APVGHAYSHLIADAKMLYAKVNIIFSLLCGEDFTSRLNTISEGNLDHFPLRCLIFVNMLRSIPTTAHAIVRGSKLNHIDARNRTYYFYVVHCFCLFYHNSYNSFPHHFSIVHLSVFRPKTDPSSVRI